MPFQVQARLVEISVEIEKVENTLSRCSQSQPSQLWASRTFDFVPNASCLPPFRRSGFVEYVPFKMTKIQGDLIHLERWQ